MIFVQRVGEPLLAAAASAGAELLSRLGLLLSEKLLQIN